MLCVCVFRQQRRCLFAVGSLCRYAAEFINLFVFYKIYTIFIWNDENELAFIGVMRFDSGLPAIAAGYLSFLFYSLCAQHFIFMLLLIGGTFNNVKTRHNTQKPHCDCNKMQIQSHFVFIVSELTYRFEEACVRSLKYCKIATQWMHFMGTSFASCKILTFCCFIRQSFVKWNFRCDKQRTHPINY